MVEFLTYISRQERPASLPPSLCQSFRVRVPQSWCRCKRWCGEREGICSLNLGWGRDFRGWGRGLVVSESFNSWWKKSLTRIMIICFSYGFLYSHLRMVSGKCKSWKLFPRSLKALLSWSKNIVFETLKTSCKCRRDEQNVEMDPRWACLFHSLWL